MHTTHHTMLQLAGEGEAQEGPGRPRRGQESPGEPRRAQEIHVASIQALFHLRGAHSFQTWTIYGLIRYVHMDIFETFRG